MVPYALVEIFSCYGVVAILRAQATLICSGPKSTIKYNTLTGVDCKALYMLEADVKLSTINAIFNILSRIWIDVYVCLTGLGFTANETPRPEYLSPTSLAHIDNHERIWRCTKFIRVACHYLFDAVIFNIQSLAVAVWRVRKHFTLQLSIASPLSHPGKLLLLPMLLLLLLLLLVPLLLTILLFSLSSSLLPLCCPCRRARTAGGASSNNRKSSKSSSGTSGKAGSSSSSSKFEKGPPYFPLSAPASMPNTIKSFIPVHHLHPSSSVSYRLVLPQHRSHYLSCDPSLATAITLKQLISRAHGFPTPGLARQKLRPLST